MDEQRIKVPIQLKKSVDNPSQLQCIK